MNDPRAGGKCTESLANYDPDSRSWKTSQTSFIPELNKFAGRWPRSGMMRNGTLYPLPTSVRRTSANASGLWPTPTAHTAYDRNTKYCQGGTPLTVAVKMWPTPTVSPGRNATSGRKPDSKHHSGTTLYDIAYQEGGKLNPNWVEWLMGYPPGWTDLED